MEIEKRRKEIDNVDDEILELFIKRIKIVKKVAAYKKKNALPVQNSAREKELLHRLCLKEDETMKKLSSAIEQFSRIV